MPETFEPGEHVLADAGDGYRIAHVKAGPHENAAGETKYLVQMPGGGAVELGHREPADLDEHGSGGTFKRL